MGMLKKFYPKEYVASTYFIDFCLRLRIELLSSAGRESITFVFSLLQKGHFITFLIEWFDRLGKILS